MFLSFYELTIVKKMIVGELHDDVKKIIFADSKRH